MDDIKLAQLGNKDAAKRLTEAGASPRVVQEIASLLGETTAETKIALTKLKNSMAD